MGILGFTKFINASNIQVDVDITVEALKVANEHLKALAQQRAGAGAALKAGENTSPELSLKQLINDLPRLEIVIDGNSFTFTFAERSEYNLFYSGDTSQLQLAVNEYLGAFMAPCYLIHKDTATLAAAARADMRPGDADVYDDGEFLCVPVVRFHAFFDGMGETLKVGTHQRRTNDNVQDLLNLWTGLPADFHPAVPRDETALRYGEYGGFKNVGDAGQNDSRSYSKRAVSLQKAPPFNALVADAMLALGKLYQLMIATVCRCATDFLMLSFSLLPLLQYRYW